MTMNEYQLAARRTVNGALSKEELTMHALHGLASEVGEIHSIYQHRYQGEAVNPSKVLEELGDLLWFAAELATALGEPLDSVAWDNIYKLRFRYPDRYSDERSRRRHEMDGDGHGD